MIEDIELLIIARRHEKLLLRVAAGEFEDSLSSAIEKIKEEASATSVFTANLLAIVKSNVMGCDIGPDLLRIKNATNEKTCGVSE